jgi:peptidoglycan/LPS O-acetylase OafA/YrhL
MVAEMVLQATLSENFTPQGDGFVNALLPLSYQGAVVGASAVAVFVVVRSVVHPASALAATIPAGRMRFLGDLTFGVFAVHLLVLWALTQAPGLDVEDGATTAPGVLLLSAVVLTVSFGVAWLLSRTPVLRRAV